MSYRKLSVLVACMIGMVSTPLFAQTIYNGDIIQGRKVITELDVNDLAKGKVHELFFRAGSENNAGQFYYVPVSVIRGRAEGKRVLQGVHANEMNSYLTVNLIKNQLSPSTMSGRKAEPPTSLKKCPTRISDDLPYWRVTSGCLNFLWVS